jgi:hypothetical protein
MKPGTANALSPLAVFAAMVLALSVLFVVANCKKRLPPPAPVAKLVPGPAPQEEPPVIMPPAPAPTQGSTPVRVLAQVSPVAASPIASPSPPVKGAQPGHEPETKVVGRAVGLQADRWYAAKIKPVWRDSINKAVMLYERTQERYKTVEKSGAMAFLRRSSSVFTCESPITHSGRTFMKDRVFNIERATCQRVDYPLQRSRLINGKSAPRTRYTSLTNCKASGKI